MLKDVIYYPRISINSCAADERQINQFHDLTEIKLQRLFKNKWIILNITDW